jgi:O-acetylhomoserine/O-acetylserine sulfhydrylase
VQRFSLTLKFYKQAVFEERITALEGGVAAVAASSGLGAEFMAIATIASAGDNIVVS